MKEKGISVLCQLELGIALLLTIHTPLFEQTMVVVAFMTTSFSAGHEHQEQMTNMTLGEIRGMVRGSITPHTIQVSQSTWFLIALPEKLEYEPHQRSPEICLVGTLDALTFPTCMCKHCSWPIQR